MVVGSNRQLLIGWTVRICLVTSAAWCHALDATPRTWQSRAGRKVRAALEADHGTHVSLKRPDGTVLQIRFDSLSEADRRYLHTLRETRQKTSRDAFRARLSASRAKPEKPERIRADYLSRLEIEVIEEMNAARSDPGGYARHVARYLATGDGNGTFVLPGFARSSMQEGAPAIEEAIAFLEDVKPLPSLRPSRALSLAARDHADDVGPKGLVSHTGSDESTFSGRIKRHGRYSSGAGENISYGPTEARGIVIQFIVDDGVPSRGHRLNIFSRQYGTVGVSQRPHTRYGSCCVVDFAGGIHGE